MFSLQQLAIQFTGLIPMKSGHCVVPCDLRDGGTAILYLALNRRHVNAEEEC